MLKSHPHPLTTTNSVDEPPATRRPHHWKVVWKRRIASASRWLHLYLSMASFAILFFFAVTGLTLNHTEWFNGQERTALHKGGLDPKWTSTADAKDVAKLEIVEHLRQADGVRGALTDFRVDDSQCAVSFKGPGYTADAFIDRSSGKYELTETRLGFGAIVNDLHKGRDAGPVWKLMIDIAAVLMTLVSMSGMVLIFFLQKRRVPGLMLFAAGGLLCYAIYRIFVP